MTAGAATYGTVGGTGQPLRISVRLLLARHRSGMNPPGADTVLVRLSGEVGVKSAPVQRRMERTLQGNLEAMLAARGLDGEVEHEHSRLYVHTSNASVDAVTAAVTGAFGVTSASPAVTVEPTMSAIEEALVRTARGHYEGGTFAVRARRAGTADAHPFTSTDIERQGGAAVFETAEDAGVEPAVDLDEPDLTFGVECRTDRAFVYLAVVDGPGGLPLGTQDPLVALVSGGIDSPVAAWTAMKRGPPVYPLYVDLGPYGGPDHRARAERAVSKLARYTPEGLTMWVAPGGDGLERIDAGSDSLRMLLVRRFMLRVGAYVAEEVGAVGLVTGEAIGQKSSQTSAALRATDAVADLPVHRPLLTLDKTEIIERAKALDTFEDATIDAGCNRLAPDSPAVRPAPETVAGAEPMGIDDLAHTAAEEAERVDVHPGTNL